MPLRRLQRLRETRLQRPEVDAVRVGEQLREGQPVRVGAEAVAVRAEAQHQVEPPLGAAGAPVELRGELLGVPAVDRASAVSLTALPRVWLDDQVVDGRRVGAVHAGDGEDQPGEDLASRPCGPSSRGTAARV